MGLFTTVAVPLNTQLISHSLTRGPLNMVAVDLCPGEWDRYSVIALTFFSSAKSKMCGREPQHNESSIMKFPRQ